LAKLPIGHSFKEAIAALIHSVAFDKSIINVFIIFKGPTPFGVISVAGISLSYRETEGGGPYSKGDLIQERIITDKTLGEIARVIGKTEL
jgi:hypothetical protein